MLPKTDETLRNWLFDVPVALVLLTRLPLPALPEAAFRNSARAVWAYPVVGILLGVLIACVMFMTQTLPAPLSAGLVLAALTVLTGAMHEDGLADTADGLWGGSDRARRLDIMKDSRIGAYGVLALIIVMGLRWHGLTGAEWTAILSALVLSRAMMPALMWALPHARSTGLSHSVGRPGLGPSLAAVSIGAVVTVSLTGALGFLALAVACGTAALIATVAKSKIGGQTGDILGATQILSEVAILIILSHNF